VNLATTALHALGLKEGTPLAPGLLDRDLLRGVERVSVVLVDGLGFEQLMAVKGKESLALFDAAASGVLKPITTVSPSTTTTAMASVSTASPPVAHGLLGYRLYLKEFACMANMIKFAPVFGGTGFESRGVDPRSFLTATTVYQRLTAKGIPAMALTRKDYLGSALSKMIHAGAEVRGYASASDLVVPLRRFLESRKRGFVFAYWDLLDSLAHRYGALTPEYLAELSLLDHALDREVFSKKGDGKTLLLLTADHGHINVPTENRINLQGHPDLVNDLLLPPAGEPRYAYLYPKPGRAAAVREYLAKEFRGKAAVFTAAEALKRGYFGPGVRHPAALDRLGEVHLTPTQDHAFLFPFPGEKSELIGRHGGFSTAEMLVPLLAVRL